MLLSSKPHFAATYTLLLVLSVTVQVTVLQIVIGRTEKLCMILSFFYTIFFGTCFLNKIFHYLVQLLKCAVYHHVTDLEIIVLDFPEL